MNIFVLDNNPTQAAQFHANTHVVKMIVELAQLLSTAHRLIDGEEKIWIKYVAGSLPARYRKSKRWVLPDHREPALYKATHVNHPCAIWVRESYENYMWTWQMMAALLDEYWLRYGQKKGTHHKVRTSGLEQLLCKAPDKMVGKALTPFAQAMPDQYRNPNPVDAYRAYYRGAKSNLLKYTNRAPPNWL